MTRNLEAQQTSSEKPGEMPRETSGRDAEALTGLTPPAIAARLGVAPMQGRQIFRWLQRKQVFEVDRMTDLSKDLRAALVERTDVSCLQQETLSASPSSGTRKALFRLRDGETIESVLIRDRDRVTLCLSTQVGCAIKCSFCATGMGGFRRNLTVSEIVEQALRLIAEADLGERTPNIVLMGMGEPFRNYEASMGAVRLLMNKEGLRIGARKITISTAGEVKGIERFAGEGLQVRLSVSLHAANDALRDQLVPLNRKYPLAMLIEAVRSYIARTGRQVTFEWTLLRDVNDSPKDAEELCDVAGPLKAVVNLIPCNPVAGLGYRAPSSARCQAFQAALTARGVKSTLRKERGQDILAACGQLRRRVERAQEGD